MNTNDKLNRRSKSIGGHTAQYITLAEGLRQTAEAMEADLAYLGKKGYSVSMASLRMEARCAVVTLLSAALCESVANTVLAELLTRGAYLKIKGSMPSKWCELIPDVLACPPPSDEIVQTLRLLQKTRNAIVHAEATVFGEDKTIHIRGTDDRWINLTPETARKFIELPVCLAEIIPPSAGILYAGIGSSLRERQPRLPRVHVNEVLTALHLLGRRERQILRAAVDRMDKEEAS